MIHSEFGKIKIAGPALFVKADFAVLCKSMVDALMKNEGMTRDEAKVDVIQLAIEGVEVDDDKDDKDDGKDDDRLDKTLDEIGSIIDMIKEAINDEADD